MRPDGATAGIRVLHVISGIDPTDGGPCMALMGLTKALVRRHANVTVVATPRPTEDLRVVEEIRRSGARVQLAGPRCTLFQWRKKLRATLEEEVGRADVVHIHALWEQVQYLTACVARRRWKPFIMRPCGLLDPWSLARGWLKKRIYLELRLRRYLNAAAGLHFSTDLERERTRSLHLRAPVIVEPNGIDLHEFKQLPPRGAFRSRAGIPDGVPLVLFLGRLHPKKGLNLLIPAFADVAPRNAVLAIVGTGESEYQRQLRQQVEARGIADRVVFPGFLHGRDRIAAFADATVFVLPSYAENFANTVIESLAAGTPVIISDQVNLHTEVKSARVGGVVDTSTTALSRELQAWLADASRRDAAIRNARSFLEAYDWNHIASRWLARYREFDQQARETRV